MKNIYIILLSLFIFSTYLFSYSVIDNPGLNKPQSLNEIDSITILDSRGSTLNRDMDEYFIELYKEYLPAHLLNNES